jgi:hypothetical protein
MKRKYTAFTKAFKQQALDLASQPNTCIARLARDLGIRRNLIYKMIIDRDTAYNSFLKLPSAGLRGSNGKNISRIGNGAYLWTRSPASTDG